MNFRALFSHAVRRPCARRARDYHTPDSTVDNLGGGGAACLLSSVGLSASNVNTENTDSLASVLGAVSSSNVAAALDADAAVVVVSSEPPQSTPSGFLTDPTSPAVASTTV